MNNIQYVVTLQNEAAKIWYHGYKIVIILSERRKSEHLMGKEVSNWIVFKMKTYTLLKVFTVFAETNINTQCRRESFLSSVSFWILQVQFTGRRKGYLLFMGRRVETLWTVVLILVEVAHNFCFCILQNNNYCIWYAYINMQKFDQGKFSNIRSSFSHFLLLLWNFFHIYVILK